MTDNAGAYAALNLRPGASPADVRRSYHELSRKHHPDKGGDAALFRRVASAFAALSAAREAAPGPVRRVVAEDAPTAWGDATAGARGGSAPALLLEGDSVVEAALRYAATHRKHQGLVAAFPAHEGWVFDATGGACGPQCLLSVAAARHAGETGVSCSHHRRIHACSAGDAGCRSDDRACPMAVLCAAAAWRRATPGVLPPAHLAAHRCAPLTCSWLELLQLRQPARGLPSVRVFVCSRSGRPHICSPPQCRAGAETRCCDEAGALGRQWRCQISGMALGPVMPFADGVTAPLGTAEVLRLAPGGGGARRLAAPRAAKPAGVRDRLHTKVGRVGKR